MFIGKESLSLTQCLTTKNFVTIKMKERTGNYFLDISKLIFGGIILSGIVSEPINRWVMYTLATFFSLFLMTMGFVILSNSDNKEKEN